MNKRLRFIAFELKQPEACSVLPPRGRSGDQWSTAVACGGLLLSSFPSLTQLPLRSAALQQLTPTRPALTSPRQGPPPGKANLRHGPRNH